SASSPRFVMTTADGYFFFRDLPAGKYSIAADGFDYLAASYPLRVIELPNRDMPTEVPLHLWKAASISGTVIDERGEPVVGIPVGAFRSSTRGGSVAIRTGETMVDTDDRGEYRIGQLSPGSYVI